MIIKDTYKLTDNIIVEEMEKKFQDYFIEQKTNNESKDNMASKLIGLLLNKKTSYKEKSLNKEMIESHQEMIIEQQEYVSPYPTKEDKYMDKKARRSDKLRESNNLHSLKELQPFNSFSLNNLTARNQNGIVCKTGTFN